MTRWIAIRNFVFFLIATTTMLVLAALWNKHPLMYPDSPYYVGSGHDFATRLYTGELANRHSERSPLYSISILPLHSWGLAMPIVVMQALVTSLMIGYMLRRELPSTSTFGKLKIVLLVVVTTGASFYTSMLMPDIFAASLVISFYYLMVSEQRTGFWGGLFLSLVAWYAIMAHMSHLLIAIVLTLVIFVYRIVDRAAFDWKGAVVSTSLPAAIICCALFSTFAINYRLYHRLTLSGVQPPFLLARIVGDGTVQKYLAAHATEHDWQIIQFIDKLPYDSDDFLWHKDCQWVGQSDEVRERLLDEQMEVVSTVVLALPLDQLLASTYNTVYQFLLVEHSGLFDWRQDIWDGISLAAPDMLERYGASLQNRRQLPVHALTWFHHIVWFVSLFWLVWLWAKCRGTTTARLIVYMLVAFLINAMIAGAISGPHDRYQGRVAWLGTMVAIIGTIQYRMSQLRPLNPSPVSQPGQRKFGELDEADRG